MLFEKSMYALQQQYMQLKSILLPILHIFISCIYLSCMWNSCISGTARRHFVLKWITFAPLSDDNKESLSLSFNFFSRNLNWTILVFDPNKNVKFIANFVYSRLSRTQSNSATLRIVQLNKVVLFRLNFLRHLLSLLLFFLLLPHLCSIHPKKQNDKWCKMHFWPTSFNTLLDSTQW